MYSEDCRHFLNIWLHQLQETTSDPASMRAAADHIASCASCQNRLSKLVQAINGSIEDPLTCDECQTQLPAYIDAHAAGSSDDRFEEAREHLALCPHCAGVYAQVAELVRASRADAIPVAASYPEFDLSMLYETTWAGDIVQDALDQGRQWIQDAAGALYVLLGPDVSTQPTPAWATKSAQPGTLLYQTTISDQPAEEWEVEVLAFAEDDDYCRVEVALYRAGAADDELAQIPITFRYGEISETHMTDSGGVAEFTGVPIAALDEVVFRVAPRD